MQNVTNALEHIFYRNCNCSNSKKSDISRKADHALTHETHTRPFNDQFPILPADGSLTCQSKRNIYRPSAFDNIRQSTSKQ